MYQQKNYVLIQFCNHCSKLCGFTASLSHARNFISFPPLIFGNMLNIWRRAHSANYFVSENAPEIKTREKSHWTLNSQGGFKLNTFVVCLQRGINVSLQASRLKIKWDICIQVYLLEGTCLSRQAIGSFMFGLCRMYQIWYKKIIWFQRTNKLKQMQ